MFFYFAKNKQEVQGNYNSTIGVIPINDIIETIIGAIKDLGVPAILLFLVTRYYTNKDKREEDKRKAALEQAKNSNERLTKLETEVKRQAGKDEELYNNVDEIGNFMEITLENSVWDYRPDFNWGDFTEFTEERFYKIPLSLFGGKLKVHKINLNVDKSDIVNDEWNTEDKPWHDEPLFIKNPYSGEKRNIQYGDDLARESKDYSMTHTKGTQN